MTKRRRRKSNEVPVSLEGGVQERGKMVVDSEVAGRQDAMSSGLLLPDSYASREVFPASRGHIGPQAG